MTAAKITLLARVMLALGGSCLAFAASAAEPGVTDTTIVLGSVTPVSGPPSLLGKAHFLGSRVWQEDVNSRGGINGRKVELRTEDDGYVPQRSLQVLKKLVEQDNIFALLGTSGAAGLMAMMPFIDEQQLPTINTMAVARAHFSPPHKTLFVVGPTYCQEMAAAFKHLVESRKLQKEKFGVIYQEDEYGADILCGYQKTVKELGLSNVAETPFKRGAKDFAAEVLGFKRAGVTFIVSGGVVTEHAAILKEVSKNQMSVTYITVHGAHLPVAQALVGNAVEFFYVGDYVPPMTSTAIPGATKFMALAQKYLTPDEIKSLNRYSFVAYVGALVMEEGIRQCGRALTRACVVDRLENLKDFKTDGLMSPIGFGPNNRHAPSAVILLRSNNKAGKFEEVSGFIPVSD